MNSEPHQSIEDLIGMDLATLVAMTDEEITAYLHESLQICPPIENPATAKTTNPAGQFPLGSMSKPQRRTGNEIQSSYAKKMLLKQRVDERFAAILAKASANIEESKI